jgi:hypothetical protein
MSLPAALTSGSSNSRGPSSLSLTGAVRSRAWPSFRAAPWSSALPPLSAQRLRTLVSADTAAGTLLQCYLSAGGTPVAMLARQPTLSRLRPGQTTPARPEPALPCPPAPTACRRTQPRDPAGRGRRGPAPSGISRKNRGPALSSSWLLCLFSAHAPFTPAAFLLLLVPPSVTPRPSTRSQSASAPSARLTAQARAGAATSLNPTCYVVTYCESQPHRAILPSTPIAEGGAGGPDVPVPRFLSLIGGDRGGTRHGRGTHGGCPSLRGNALG